MIEAVRISVRIGGKTIIEDVSLSIRSGETVALVGCNGAGKSTLLKTLTGDILPSDGVVALNGRGIHAWTARERAQMRAVLPQESTLTFHFTVLEVVLMGRTPHVKGAETTRDYDIARSALALTDTLKLERRVYTTLSGGERQRVQLARALAQIWDPSPNGVRFLLLDEPTSSLDLAHQHAALSVAKRLADAEGAGVVAALHDLNLAAQYADRIVVMKEGRLVATGHPNEILAPAIIEEAFGVRVFTVRHPHSSHPHVIIAPPSADERVAG
jgi:iron complex transport system ATP-binding protein